MVSVKTTAVALVTGTNAIQLDPPSIEYSQVPLELSTEVTAMPSTAPVSTSVTLSPPALAMIVATSEPLGSVLFFSTFGKSIRPELSRTVAH